PAHLVDLVRGGGLAVAVHQVVANLLLAPLAVAVVRAAELGAEAAAQARLLLDLADGGLLPALARVELPLGERPVAVVRTVDEQHRAVTDDHAARSADLWLTLAQTSTRSASPWPPPEQIAATPSPPPSRRSSWIRVVR